VLKLTGFSTILFLMKRTFLIFTLACITALLTALQLRAQGRSWWCACNELFLWAGNIWSRHNSQHLFDPYSFTHVLHGLAFCGLLALIRPALSYSVKFYLAVLIESLWEILENTERVIQRYREATLALGYEGDTVANSVSDIFLCAAGFWLANRLGLKRSIVVFVIAELALVFWIRDSLVLNIIMLVYPLDFIRNWQSGT
jgi:hypothetical protein